MACTGTNIEQLYSSNPLVPQPTDIFYLVRSSNPLATKDGAQAFSKLVTQKITTFADSAAESIDAEKAYKLFASGTLGQSSTITLSNLETGSFFSLAVTNSNVGAITITIANTGRTVKYYDGSDSDLGGSEDRLFSGVVVSASEIWVVKSPLVL